MRVLIFHGYLLRGTGSNVYNASLAAALVGLGHEVHLLCQERHAAELDFVGAVGDWDSGQLQIKAVRDSACTVYRPPIGPLLPVYVRDRYEGAEARPFPELTDEELRVYTEANVNAVAEVVERVRPKAALANHLIMGPAILARALDGPGIPYAVTIHGSALEYTVKPHPRFLPPAREGLARARAVLVGSRHTAQSLWAALEDPSLPPRTRLGPPGVDVDAFRPLAHQAAREWLAALAEAIEVRTLAQRIGARATASSAEEPSSDFERDGAATARALQALAHKPPEAPLVAFVGKLIPAKGIELLLRAWPSVLAEIPEARLAVVGFGAWRQEAHDLAQALGAASSIVFTGRLEHEELAALLPLCEAIVVPSTFPESFGMVAAEAAACGVLPISAAHSGLAEVSGVLAASLPESVRGLVSFPLGAGAVAAIAQRVIAWLRTPAAVRLEARTALAQAVADHYSWQSVARGVIAAARGELDALEPAGRLAPADGE